MLESTESKPAVGNGWVRCRMGRQPTDQRGHEGAVEAMSVRERLNVFALGVCAQWFTNSCHQRRTQNCLSALIDVKPLLDLANILTTHALDLHCRGHDVGVSITKRRTRYVRDLSSHGKGGRKHVRGFGDYETKYGVSRQGCRCDSRCKQSLNPHALSCAMAGTWLKHCRT